MKKNDILEVRTEEINALGFGVAKVDGMVLFVGQSAPGDVAKVRVIKVAKTYAIGKIEELITPSPMRITPTCPISASCGGCAYSHISYEEEARAKTESVRAALRKEGLSHISVRELCSPSGRKAYRNKAQMPFAPDGSLGYFAPKSHRVVVPKNGCELLPEVFVRICDTVSSFVREKGISVYDEESGKGLMRHLYLRMGVNTGEVMVCLVINGKEMPHITDLVGRLYTKYPEIRTVILNENTEKTNVILGKKCHTVFGDGIITDTLCGNTYEISPLSFYQINHATAEAIYEKAIELADLSPEDVVADLYCGIGTIGLSVAKKADISRLVGVEIIPDAVKNAKKNAEINGIKNASFYCGDANDPHIDGCNVIFVDPPRKGLSKELIERIGELGPDKVIYISCGVDTFARDLRLFKELGYETDTVYPYDMFPRTAHVECLACLVRQLDGNI